MVSNRGHRSRRRDAVARNEDSRMATKSGVSARDRARTAKATFDAARSAWDRKVEAVVIRFYTAVDAAEEAATAAESARKDRAGALADLVLLGAEDSEIASLCVGVATPEIRAARKQAKPASATPALATAEPTQ